MNSEPPIAFADDIVQLETAFEACQEHAAAWLLRSGIQVVSSDRDADGGFAAWYDVETGSYPYVYAEISGYLVTAMSWLYQRHSDAAYLASARRAADWLLNSQIYHAASGGFRCLYPLAPSRFDYKRNWVYAFDCGVILNGLVSLYRVSGEERYLAAGIRVADWLMHTCQRPDGSFRPVLDGASGEWIESNDEWSLCSGGYHTKISLGLANVYDVTRLNQYADAAVRGCDFALRYQQADGRFVTFPDSGGTNAHPHAYAAEGLWVVGSMFGREDYLSASARATRWLFEQQSPDGLVPRHFHNGQGHYHERVDILSQALRLAYIHMREGRLPESLHAQTQQLLRLVLRNQAHSVDPRIDGGFYFGRLSDGAQMSHVNCWVSAFALQALALSDQKFPVFAPYFMV
jgi:hypothetical protein